jgi:hypothetical protein
MPPVFAYLMLPNLMNRPEKITALASMKFPVVSSTVGDSATFTSAQLAWPSTPEQRRKA